MSNLVAIVGPTAVGKTALALELAEHIAMEIVSADSRQVYRLMDIGTAKPTAAERSRVTHHLLDVVDPDEPFTLAQYQKTAYAAIDATLGRGHLPVLVGGTGLYVRAVLEGLQIPAVKPNPELRQELLAVAQAEGAQALHRRLSELDAAAAERIDARNVRRVIRALEVCLELGAPMSSAQKSSPPPYRVLKLGITLSRASLYRRIDERVDSMIEAGLVEEVRQLVAQGYGLDLPALSGLGYRQIGMHLRGELTLAEAVSLTKKHTRRFVRQQYTWFRLDDESIHWLDGSTPAVAPALEFIQRFVGGSDTMDRPAAESSCQ